MELVGLSGFTQLLQDLIGGIFDAVLSPVLRDAFNIVLNMVEKMLADIFANWLLKIMVMALKLIDFMESVFNVFSGISSVRVKDVSEPISLLEYFFRIDQVQGAFLGITIVAVVLAFMTTLFAVVRSLADTPFENRNPISTVLSQAVKAAMTFMIIPITCLFVLNMTGTAVKAINTTFNFGSADLGVSDTIFLTVAEPAAKNDNAIKTFSVRRKYEDTDLIKRNFDIGKIDYTQAYAAMFFIFFILLASILQFIQRIFVILVLYLVSPFFVAMMPLDGGAKFKEWREMFVAHMLSAFGPILAMKIYLMLVPVMVGSDINYGVTGLLESAVKLLLIIGGAFAVYKSRNLLISVLNMQAAMAIDGSGIIAAMVGGAALQKLRSVGRGGGSSKGSSQKSGQQRSGGQANNMMANGMGGKQGGSGSQAYTGK